MARTAEEVCVSDQVMLPIPYDLPPPTYQKGGKLVEALCEITYFYVYVCVCLFMYE